MKLVAAGLLVALAAAAAVLVARGERGDAEAPQKGEAARSPHRAPSGRRAPTVVAPSVSASSVMRHVRALERVADRNGGNRAAGTAGDRASARYAAERLRAAGYRVRLEPVRFPFFEERRRPRLRAGGLSAARIGEVRTLAYSAGGRARGRAQAVDLDLPAGLFTRSDSGCERSDFDGFGRGRIAIIQRGKCTLQSKVERAQRAGAAGVVIFNGGQPGRTGPIDGSLGEPGARIPAVFVGHREGVALARSRGTVELDVDAVSERRTTNNVVADSSFGAGGDALVVGGHLDSVPEGPGANDNASGAGAVLAIAERAAARPERARRALRVGLWGAEELGLHGSRRHVARLEPPARRRIAGYVNLDMVGSSNGGRFLYGSGRGVAGRMEAVARRTLAARGAPARSRSLGSASDHVPFERAGIPVFGLFSGAANEKSEAQRRSWGGRAGRPFDRCYHRRCDRAARIDRRTLADLARAAAAAVFTALSDGERREERP